MWDRRAGAYARRVADFDARAGGLSQTWNSRRLTGRGGCERVRRRLEARGDGSIRAGGPAVRETERPASAAGARGTRGTPGPSPPRGRRVRPAPDDSRLSNRSRGPSARPGSLYDRRTGRRRSHRRLRASSGSRRRHRAGFAARARTARARRGRPAMLVSAARDVPSQRLQAIEAWLSTVKLIGMKEHGFVEVRSGAVFRPIVVDR